MNTRPPINSLPRIVYLDRTGLPAHISLKALNYQHQWVNFDTTSPRQIVDRCKNADIVITNKIIIDEQTLAACPNIKHIAVSATGFNVVDIQACQKRNISVSNIQNYAVRSVPEHVITTSLMLRRQLTQYRQRVIDGAWQKSPAFCLFDKRINDLGGSTMGIIGFGELGRATAKLANALGVKVIFNSQNSHPSEFATQVSMEELLTRSDIVSLHCALTPQTKNLISAKELSLMKDDSILINTARGGVANEIDVVAAIKASKIGGIGFDVLVEEPPQDNSPLLSIADRSNVILTPHTAWASDQAMQTLADQLVDNVDAFLRGKPQNIVT